DSIRALIQLLPYSGCFLWMKLVAKLGRLVALYAQPSHQRHCGLNRVRVRRGRRDNALVKSRRFVMFCADPVPPGQTTVQQTRRPAMKVHDGIEAPGEQPRRKGPLVRSTQDFIDVGIGVKAIDEWRFHENRNAECRKLRL